MIKGLWQFRIYRVHIRDSVVKTNTPSSFIIPKKPIPKVSDSNVEDKDLLGHLLLVAKKVAEEKDIADNFRLVVNNGAKAGQSVFHIHIHLLSGRPLSWPPG